MVPHIARQKSENVDGRGIGNSLSPGTVSMHLFPVWVGQQFVHNDIWYGSNQKLNNNIHSGY